MSAPPAGLPRHQDGSLNLQGITDDSAFLAIYLGWLNTELAASQQAATNANQALTTANNQVASQATVIQNLQNQPPVINVQGGGGGGGMKVPKPNSYNGTRATTRRPSCRTAKRTSAFDPRTSLPMWRRSSSLSYSSGLTLPHGDRQLWTKFFTPLSSSPLAPSNGYHSERHSSPCSATPTNLTLQPTN